MSEILEVRSWLRKCSLEQAALYGEYVFQEEMKETARRKGLAQQIFALRGTEYQWIRYFFAGEAQVFACRILEANLFQ